MILQGAAEIVALPSVQHNRCLASRLKDVNEIDVVEEQLRARRAVDRERAGYAIAQRAELEEQRRVSAAMEGTCSDAAIRHSGF